MKFDRIRLKALREAKGMTQEVVAVAVGISRQQYIAWESGEYTPPVDKIGKLGDALGVPGTFFIVNGVEE